MTSYAEKLLTACFAANGIDPEVASRAARICMKFDEATERVPADRDAAFERDARIVELRGQNVDGKPMTCRMIALRLSVDPRTVFRVIRTHQRRRRAVLRIAI